MPTIARAFIKSGLIFMIASLLVAVAIAAPDEWNLPRWINALGMTHFHLFAVGWITQIIFGVALWFFPSWSRDKPRGPEWLSWSCFATLNIGLLLRAASETAFAMGHTGTGWSWVMSASACLQLGAAIFFAVAIWPRVKGRKRRKRGSTNS